MDHRDQIAAEKDPYKTILHVCMRPKMYLDTDSFNDVLIFVIGVSTGASPPHGCLRMGEFITEKYDSDKTTPWYDVIRSELNEMEFFEACQALVQIIADYRKTTGS